LARTIEILDGDEAWPRVEGLDREVYPPHVMATVIWRDITWEHAHRRVLVTNDDVLVSHVGIYFREGTHDGAEVRIAGIGGVMTSERVRRQGCAGSAMKAAADLMREEEVDFGLLFCEAHNVNFYRNLGWRAFGGEVYCEQPKGKICFNLMGTMVLPLSRTPASGVIDLCGLPW
jgi:aminoglycoside 2'-N-acetyltransferase I